MVSFCLRQVGMGFLPHMACGHGRKQQAYVDLFLVALLRHLWLDVHTCALYVGCAELGD